MSYRVAIIGCGRMASTIDDERPAGWPHAPSTHASAFKQLEQTTVIAGVNRGTKGLQAFQRRWGVTNGYADYRQMLEAEQPDIVSICTPQESHAEITMECARAGVRGIICEKAMCGSMVEADAVLAALGDRVAYNLGVQRRFRLDCLTARDLIDAGEIGPPRFFHLTSAGALMRTFSHYFDVMSMLLGDPQPVRVTGLLEDVRGGKPCGYDAVSNRYLDDPPLRWATVEFADGQIGQVTSPAGGLTFREWRVAGRDGEVSFVDDGSPPVWRTAAGPRQYPAFERIDSPTVRMVRDLLQAMQTGGPTRAGARRSAAVTEICLAVAESHRLGGHPVQLPLANRELLVPSP